MEGGNEVREANGITHLPTGEQSLGIEFKQYALRSKYYALRTIYKILFHLILNVNTRAIDFRKME